VVFLGAPRSEAAAKARECGTGMRAAMAVLGACCLIIGLAPAFFWPTLLRVTGVWAHTDSSRIIPNHLSPLGTAHLLLAISALGVAATAVILLRGRQRRAMTWDCGYSAPSSRMQYTAGSFAGIITAWFGWILRPAVKVSLPVDIFPARSSLESRTPETVLEQVVIPASTYIVRLADFVRTFQHGRVQSYLLYLCAAILVLSITVLL
jgi:hydrogenase-4 component B